MSIARLDDGTRINFVVTGTGPEVLLVAGQGYGIESWVGFRERLSAHFTVIAYDHRGVGQSELGSANNGPHSTRTFARDAIAVLDAAGVSAACVFGFSMGGRICQWMAIDFPDRIARMVLGATSSGDRYGPPRDAETDRILRTRNPEGLSELLVTPEWASRHKHEEEVLLRPPPAETLALHYRVSRSHDVWDFLPMIQTQTLILHGSADRVNSSEHATLLASRIRSAEVRLISDARHCFYAENSASSNIVSEFFR